MIKNIHKCAKFGKFTDFQQEKDFVYSLPNQNCNIILGANGSGKTTLSNILSLFSNNLFISEDEKKEIFNDIKIDDTAYVEINTQDGILKYPANRAHDKNIFVFNQNFVSSHVFDGTKGNLKKFSKTGNANIKNDDIVKITEKINALERESDELKKENISLQENIKNITNKYSGKFGKNLTDANKRLNAPKLEQIYVAPTKTCEELENDINSLKMKYELSKRQADMIGDCEELAKLDFKITDIDIPSIKLLLEKTIQQISKQALQNRISEIKNVLVDESDKNKVESWFRFGKSILKQVKNNCKTICCPICNNNISDSIESILQDFDKYFDMEYEHFIEELKAVKTKVENFINDIKTNKNNFIILSKQKQKYTHIQIEQSMPNIDFEEIENFFTELAASIDAKLSNVYVPVSFIPKYKFDSVCYENYIDNLDKIKSALLSSLQSQKLNTNAIEKEMRAIYNDLILVEFDQSIKDGGIKKFSKNMKKLNEISKADDNDDKTLSFYKKSLTEKLKQIKSESKGIGKFLGLMGIEHFSVDINEDAPDENIVISYIPAMVTKNKLKNTLSEGEKTALAFSYFLSKYENEIKASNKAAEAIVIIDDPISSLDENRLYSTAYLIEETFKDIKQLIVLSHNFLFLKFFNSFYAGKANCLFLDNNKLIELPPELKNFETPYFYMLKSIIEYAEGVNNDYISAKRYLPNYIRRVLETFLSFKFAIIADNGRPNNSPGLNAFGDKIAELDGLDEETKQDLKYKLAYIVKVTDPHSHGNPQQISENFHISEQDLKKIATTALHIMKTIDGFNMANVQAMLITTEKTETVRKPQQMAKGTGFNPLDF